MGAKHDTNAPHNEQENTAKRFEIEVFQALRKPITVTSSRHNAIVDDDGRYESVDTDDIDWKDMYKADHYTPQELIMKLKEVLEILLQDKRINRSTAKRLIAECDGWIIEDEAFWGMIK